MAKYPETYSEAIKIFLIDKLEELDITVPKDISFEDLRYVFELYCYGDFSKSVEEHFENFFYQYDKKKKELKTPDWEWIKDRICDKWFG